MIRTALTRRFAIAAVVVAALGASSVAFAGGPLTGKYATTIKSPPELKGTWVLNLAKGGTYTVALKGKVLARGTYSTNRSRITFGRETGGGCPKSGTYTWKKSGKTLRFTRVNESPQCGARAGVLAHTFTQQR